MCSLDHIDWYSMLIHDTQTATALGKLGHPDGELNLTKAAAKHGVIQMVDNLQEKSTLTDFTRMVRFQHSLRALLTKSWTHHIPVKCNSTNCGSQARFFCNELTRCYRYVNKDRNITKKLVQHAEARGIKGLFITVDAPQLGRREKVSVTFAPGVRILTGKTNRTCE